MVDQITITKKELPELKIWLERKNKVLLEINEIGKNSIRVFVKNN